LPLVRISKFHTGLTRSPLHVATWNHCSRSSDRVRTLTAQ